MKPSRHVVHAPIPCHPQPVKSSSISLPWPLSESSDWVSAAAGGSSPTMQTSPRTHLPRYPNLIPLTSQASTRRHGFVSPWQKPNSHQPPAKEPTVVFKLRRVPDYPESDSKTPEKKESPPLKCEKVSGEWLRDSCDRPLDLSDRGKSKSNQFPSDYSPIALVSEAGPQRSPDHSVNQSASSPSLVVIPSSSFTAPVKRREQEPTGDQNNEVTSTFLLKLQ